MIDFYALTSPNVQKVFLMLEEVELPYKVIPVDVWAGKQFEAEFKKLNPNAKIPVIVDHDSYGGKPHTVFESGAILLYLAEKTGKYLPKDPAARMDTIQWLFWQMATVGPMFGQKVHFTLFAPKGNEYSATRYKTEVLRLYDVLEARLGQSQYIGSIDYSIADMACFPWMRGYESHGATRASHPNVARWVDSVMARPATKRMLEKIAELQAKSSREKATDEQKDRFFGRGQYARV
jgi:GST-like protein